MWYTYPDSIFTNENFTTTNMQYDAAVLVLSNPVTTISPIATILDPSPLEQPGEGRLPEST